ncbi:MAG: response regulator transcription factor, partial [Acidobacteria bacterium]|nr:response regulator transcription factor [Acidobacteriota bacterium]
MTPVSIALVDDHRVVARSLKAYLESFPDLQVVGIAASGEELLENLERWKPQIVLQDLLMPGGMDGIETTRRISECAPSVKVIALTASTEEARMMGALRAGAAGYVRKDAEPEILLAAVRAVARGKTYIDPSVSRQILQAAVPHDDLTPREVEVLRQLALRRSSKRSSAVLFRSKSCSRTLAARATPSAAREGQPERGHLLAVANQQVVAGQHRVVPGLALDRRDPRELLELVDGRSDQRQLTLLRHHQQQVLVGQQDELPLAVASALPLALAVLEVDAREYGAVEAEGMAIVNDEVVEVGLQPFRRPALFDGPSAGSVRD